MTFPAAEVQSLTPGTLVVLYELDATSLGDTIHRFHAGVNGLGSDVVWQGNTYYRMPIQAEGFEISSKGVLPRPKIRVAAIDGAMGILVRGYDDLVGAKVTRKRTLAKFLDADNFEATTATNEAFTPNQLSIGGVNVTAGVTVTAMTRTDWQGAIGLLPTSRTNLLGRSQTLNLWTISGTGTVVTQDAATAPDGTATAEKVDLTSSTSGGGIYRQSYGSFTGLTLTRSIWLRGVVGGESVYLLDSTGGGGSVKCTLTTSWQRFTKTQSDRTTAAGIFIKKDDASPSHQIYAWGGQLETGSVATSYIPNAGTTPVSMTDYSATPAGVVTLGEAVSGTYTWSGSGKLNANADPTAAFADDVFFVERKVYEGPDFLEFELVSALDLEGLLLPRRKFIRNVCTWDDAAICAYSVNGLCPKDKVACEARWGTGQPLPFGGFLGIQTS